MRFLIVVFMLFPALGFAHEGIGAKAESAFEQKLEEVELETLKNIADLSDIVSELIEAKLEKGKNPRRTTFVDGYMGALVLSIAQVKQGEFAHTTTKNYEHQVDTLTNINKQVRGLIIDVAGHGVSSKDQKMIERTVQINRGLDDLQSIIVRAR